MKQRANARPRAGGQTDDDEFEPTHLRHQPPAQYQSTCSEGTRSSDRRRRAPKKLNRRSNNGDDEDESFAVLFVKVGVCVFFAGLILWYGVFKHVIGSFGGGTGTD